MGHVLKAMTSAQAPSWGRNEKKEAKEKEKPTGTSYNFSLFFLMAKDIEILEIQKVKRQCYMLPTPQFHIRDRVLSDANGERHSVAFDRSKGASCLSQPDPEYS